MAVDFTIVSYKKLINTFLEIEYRFANLSQVSLTGFRASSKTILLRHDVDSLPANSLEFAKIQDRLGISGTYYFRIVPGSFDERVIKEIAGLGHEIGYHYEDVSLAAKLHRAQGTGHRAQEDIDKEDDFEKYLAGIAIESFKKNLERLRQIVPVKTICMHGSPMSRWDSRLLWKYYDYRDFGIIGEPYFDIDFSEVLYLTDTGRRWDGGGVNIRDKATGDRRQATGTIGRETRPAPCALRPVPFPEFHSSFDIIKAAEAGTLPDKIMMTFHPQRWSDKPVPWVKELVWQNVKNVGKYFLIRIRH